MPDPGRPAQWVESDASNVRGEPWLSHASRWKTPAEPPSRGWRTTAIPGLPLVQPDAAAVALLWRERASILPCQAPGAVPPAARWGGSLPRAASSFTLPQSSRAVAASQPPADWRNSVIREQADDSRMCRLPGFCQTAATGGVRALPRLAWTAPAEWQNARPLLRADLSGQASEARKDAEHWAGQASQEDPANAELTAVSHGRPASFFSPGRLFPPGRKLPKEPFSPVGLTPERRLQIVAPAWTGEEAAQRAISASLPGVPGATVHPPARFDFAAEHGPVPQVIAASRSGGMVGEKWPGGGAMIDAPGFFKPFPVSRHLRHTAAQVHQPQRIVTRLVAGGMPPAASVWQSAKGALRMPGQAHPGPISLVREDFWPSTAFVVRPPGAARHPASGTHNQVYVHAPAVLLVAWRSLGLSHAVRRPEFRLGAAERSTAPPPAASPAALWRLPSQTVMDASLATAAPASAVQPAQWEPESCSTYRMFEVGRAAWGRAELESPEWRNDGISSLPVMLPVCGPVFRVCSLGRHFESGAGMEPARIVGAGAGPLHHPERLKLRHLVCRFPKAHATGSLRMGGAGPSEFRFSGISREGKIG